MDVTSLAAVAPPKAAEAVRAGSVGPWQPGGISAYQLDAGREQAAQEGREYDAYGAVALSTD